MEVKKILCFGDSNTWGYMPSNGGRYTEGERWSGILQQYLGDAVTVVEDGMPGRTTYFTDSSQGFSDGSISLPVSIQQHQPDTLILLLGTNDLKTNFNQSAEEISYNASRLAELAKEVSQQADKILTVILIAPPVIDQTGSFSQFFEDGEERSRQFSAYFKQRASENNYRFIDASDYVGANPPDGIHWNSDDHQRLAQGIFKLINT